MHVLKTRAQLTSLKKLLDLGRMKPQEDTLCIRGVLQSALEGLWDYEVVVDQWPSTPQAVVCRPVQSGKLPFINRLVYMAASDVGSLKELLSHKDALDWTKPIKFEILQESFKDLVHMISQQNKGDFKEISGRRVVFLENGKAALTSFEMPSDLSFGPMKEEHASLVVGNRYREAVLANPEEWTGLVEYYIKHMPSYAFYDSSGRPVAWTVTDLVGCGRFTYTFPEYRGRRLFNIGSKYWAAELHQRGRSGFAVVSLDNKMPLKAVGDFYERVGEVIVHYRHEPQSQAKSQL